MGVLTWGSMVAFNTVYIGDLTWGSMTGIYN